MHSYGDTSCPCCESHVRFRHHRLTSAEGPLFPVEHGLSCSSPFGLEKFMRPSRHDKGEALAYWMGLDRTTFVAVDDEQVRGTYFTPITIKGRSGLPWRPSRDPTCVMAPSGSKCGLLEKGQSNPVPDPFRTQPVVATPLFQLGPLLHYGGPGSRSGDAVSSAS